MEVVPHLTLRLIGNSVTEEAQVPSPIPGSSSACFCSLSTLLPSALGTHRWMRWLTDGA